MLRKVFDTSAKTNYDFNITKEGFMKSSARAMTLFLEFIGSAAIGLAVFSILRWDGMPLFRALTVGLIYGSVIAVARPFYVPQLNPIVTLGLWMSRRLGTLRSIANIVMQMLGGAAAWQLSEYLLQTPLKNLSGDEFSWQIFTAEAVGAFIFTFLLSMVFYRSKLDELKLVFVAIASVTVGMVVASLAPGGYGVINPALALGIQAWSWTYVLGAFAGGFVGMNLYPALLMFDRPKKVKTVAVKKTKATKAKAKKKTTKKK